MQFSYIKDLHELYEDLLIRQTKFKLSAPVTIIDANQDLEILSDTYNELRRQILDNARRSIFT